jgi:hypothetical protein
MKAQRRHELKQNSLVKSIAELSGKGNFFQQYQSQLLLGSVVVALIIVLIRYRMSSAQERVNLAQQSLSLALEDLKELKQTPPLGNEVQRVVSHREDVYSDGVKQVEDVLAKAPASLAMTRAQALVALGDLNFEMANCPAPPGATTQPGLLPALPMDELLKNAADAYGQVVQDYAGQPDSLVAARFGLAAVAENRVAESDWKDKSQWDEAKSQYQAIVDADVPQPYKDLAVSRLNMLPKLEQPAITGLSAAFSLPKTSPGEIGPDLNAGTSIPPTRPGRVLPVIPSPLKSTSATEPSAATQQ